MAASVLLAQTRKVLQTFEAGTKLKRQGMRPPRLVPRLAESYLER
ncbi:MAG: hypothetical protein ACK5M7_07305 [Draconibacterium sp.]